LVGIVSGLIVLAGMLRARRLPGWTALFLVTTILTSVTGFMFPISGLTPGVVFGLISIVILVIALNALYVKHLAGAWRCIYVTTALIALYLNVFVLIVQSFQKVPALQKLAPTQSEPPFSVTQAYFWWRSLFSELWPRGDFVQPRKYILRQPGALTQHCVWPLSGVFRMVDVDQSRFRQALGHF